MPMIKLVSPLQTQFSIIGFVILRWDSANFISSLPGVFRTDNTDRGARGRLGGASREKGLASPCLLTVPLSTSERAFGSRCQLLFTPHQPQCATDLPQRSEAIFGGIPPLSKHL